MWYIGRHEITQSSLAVIFTRQLIVTVQSLLFFKDRFHIVHIALNYVSLLGHFVLTTASQSQHDLAPVFLSELIFPLAHSDPFALAVCLFWECAKQFPSSGSLYLLFSMFGTLFPFTSLNLYHCSGPSLNITSQQVFPGPSYLEQVFPFAILQPNILFTSFMAIIIIYYLILNCFLSASSLDCKILENRNFIFPMLCYNTVVLSLNIC